MKRFSSLMRSIFQKISKYAETAWGQLCYIFSRAVYGKLMRFALLYHPYDYSRRRIQYYRFTVFALGYNLYEASDLHWLHTTISNFKAFLLGTYHSRCVHLQSYMDEFCFRFNRRNISNQLFLRLTRTVATSYILLC